jgi:Uma2 family endonuclease
MTTTPIGEKLLTAHEFLRLCEQRVVKGELVKGVVSKTVSANGEHSEIAAALTSVLVNHVRPLRLGRVSTSDAGVFLERDPDTVREPDVAFISAEKLPLDVKIRGFYEVVPDLVVEIVSPGDSARYMSERVAMWQSHGVPLVWAVYPVARVVAAHPLGKPTLVYTEDDELDGGGVLPEFRCSVRDILDW